MAGDVTHEVRIAVTVVREEVWLVAAPADVVDADLLDAIRTPGDPDVLEGPLVDHEVVQEDRVLLERREVVREIPEPPAPVTVEDLATPVPDEIARPEKPPARVQSQDQLEGYVDENGQYKFRRVR